ncbi:gluconokinase [Microbacterium sp. BK668]|uniref:gluconokinase n=1 Tax=Microbacterium sp. BK668 TaxID=2512118 RepID=UPI0010D52F43|nr:gluconate kinase (SKI family) [Microbacterium sp. BK668]
MTARLVVMGPSGSGKSVVGAAIAALTRARFVDADDLHPAASIAKMAEGTPLDDADRMPWLDVVAEVLARDEGDIVIACSALARRYRDRIRSGCAEAAFVELRVDEEELSRRMGDREHFMPTALLHSQLATLEHLDDDEDGVVVRNDRSAAEVAAEALRVLRERQSLRYAARPIDQKASTVPTRPTAAIAPITQSMTCEAKP